MKTARSRGPLTRNIHLVKWVEKTAELTKPKAIHWVDGSQAENDKILREMVHVHSNKTIGQPAAREAG